MRIKSRVFGEIEIADDKVIVFENGLMGFEEYTKYTLLFDEDKAESKGVMWLQSLEEETLSFPVIDPMKIIPEYNPTVEDEWIAPIGDINSEEDIYVLAILTVPSDLTKMTMNLKAPLIINIGTMKGCQTITLNDEYEVRHNVYEYFESFKKEGKQC